MANSSSYPSGGRYFSNSVNVDKTHPVLLEIYDATVIWQNGETAKTGAWRPAVPSDFAANISLSGVSLSIGSVAVTGTTQTSIINSILPFSGMVTVSNPVYQVGITGQPVNVSGTVFSSPISATTVSNSTPSGANGLALPANSNRKGWFVQNLATGAPLFVKQGTTASTQSFSMVLKSATALFEGDGGAYIDDQPKWKGDVSVSGQNTNYIIWELV